MNDPVLIDSDPALIDSDPAPIDSEARPWGGRRDRVGRRDRHGGEQYHVEVFVTVFIGPKPKGGRGLPALIDSDDLAPIDSVRS